MKIAIVGLGAVLPGCKNLDDFWQHVIAGDDLVAEVPVERWGEGADFISEGDTKDRVFHNKGYFCADIPFMEQAESIGPQKWAQLDSVFHIALKAGIDAFYDAKWESIDRSKMGVVLGNIALPTRGSSQIVNEILGKTFKEKLTGVKQELQLGPKENYFSTSLPAELLAEVLQLQQETFTLDAACASSLYALKYACDRLQSGEVDSMLAGGICSTDSLYTQMGFTQLKARSPTGKCRPFDEAGDGLMVGEGGAIFCLKRLDDALEHGDRIYGVIRGVGISNDMSGKLMAPSSEGQLRAMTMAYDEANWSPDSVDFIECHATGTPLGDKVELASLEELLSNRRGTPCAISSVKGNIGHLLTAAGASGLIRLLLAMKNQRLPPNANFKSLTVSSQDKPYQILNQSQSWPKPENHGRRAAISGFGFGGINAHLLVEEYGPQSPEAVSMTKERRKVAIIGIGILDANQDTSDGAIGTFGVEKTKWYQSQVRDRIPSGNTYGEVRVPYGLYKIPPKEIEDMLPQQVTAMNATMIAYADAGQPVLTGPRSAVFVGLELDGIVSGYRSRWQMEQGADELFAQLGMKGNSEDREQWLEELKDEAFPFLTANRVMGSLASITASRIGREFKVGGPAITTSSMDRSGLSSLKLAVEAIQNNQQDTVIVSAVDMMGGVLPRLMASELFTAEVPSASFLDGAVSLVLQDLTHAQNSGAKIYGVIENLAVIPSSHSKKQQNVGATSGLLQLANRLQSGEGNHEDQISCVGANGLEYRLDCSSLQPRLTDVTARQVLDGEYLSLPLLGQDFKVPGILKQAHKLHGASRSGQQPMETRAEKRREKRRQRAKESRQRGSNSNFWGHLLEKMAKTEQTNQEAQKVFSESAKQAMALSSQMAKDTLLSREGASSLGLFHPTYSETSTKVAEAEPIPKYLPMNTAEALHDYEACQIFAEGKIADVFGDDFKNVDNHPTRVRLPSDRLLLCHRVMEITGQKKSLKPGTMITEHDVNSDSWYLDQGKIPTSIAIEAGQADLMLSAWLGADDHTKGMAMYRLLDAEVTFHNKLPTAGEFIRYHIHIDNFFRRGDTLLFRFGFDAYVGDIPLMTMKDGCAGFFTKEELDQGRGIIKADGDVTKGMFTGGYEPFLIARQESYNEEQLDALRAGDIGKCFGDEFDSLAVKNPVGIPGGDLRLVHRIALLDSMGGRYGRGVVIGEADIQPDDWFLTCHFVDDHVMPGTLMYECCLHTLRVFLLRHGWIGESHQVTIDPVAGEASRLKCRGQVLPDTKLVRYELHVREMGYGPDAYALVDAYMYSDDKCIVDIENMTLQLTGLTKNSVDQLWREKNEAFFPNERIREFAEGRPSKAFGMPYQVFDQGRKMARLPRGDLQLVTSIDQVVATAFRLAEGSKAKASFLNEPDSWFYNCDPSSEMPYSVLLEVALQPCGWLAAYMGSALESEQDLFFRNLQGEAKLLRTVTAASGALTIDVEAIKLAKSAGMLIQEYRFVVADQEGLVFQGTTSFGFFTEQALNQQQGIKESNIPILNHRQPATEYPSGDYLPKGKFVMNDLVEPIDWEGGLYQLGRVKAYKTVDPQDWFFHDHFYQDPVMPGSLGLEAMVQLAKIVAQKLWPEAKVFALSKDSSHSWVYRGQVRPHNDEVAIDLHVKEIIHSKKQLTFDALLYCDELLIYQLKSFTMTEV